MVTMAFANGDRRGGPLSDKNELPGCFCGLAVWPFWPVAIGNIPQNR